MFPNLGSGQQYLSNDKKWLVQKSKFVWRKKNPPRAQIFRYFRIESQHPKDARIRAKSWKFRFLNWLKWQSLNPITLQKNFLSESFSN